MAFNTDEFSYGNIKQINICLSYTQYRVFYFGKAITENEDFWCSAKTVGMPEDVLSQVTPCVGKKVVTPLVVVNIFVK